MAGLQISLDMSYNEGLTLVCEGDRLLMYWPPAGANDSTWEPASMGKGANRTGSLVGSADSVFLFLQMSSTEAMLNPVSHSSPRGVGASIFLCSTTSQ